MNSQTSTARGRHEHPPQTASVRSVASHPVRRVGALDRAALHIGVALIKWGRRPARANPREELALNAETHRARLEAERLREQVKAYYLTRIL